MQVLNFVYEHMAEGERRQKLKALLDKGTFSLRYMPYDWSSNSSKK